MEAILSRPEADAAAFDATRVLPVAGGAARAEADLTLEIAGDTAPPPCIGRYVLRHQLGEGGLGQVHEAWDPVLSRTVAIKTLQLEVARASREALDELFLHEARLAAGLNHPDIVTIFDAGRTPHGVYIAMERLHGHDLRHALRQGWQPTPAQAARLAKRVAEALAYAHAQGVVHCDVKPANVFLVADDDPKLLDFGIARALHGSDGGRFAALDGMVIGSPYYLAPEQLRGESVDERTDVYSLGVVLYEMLTGRKPFEGSSLEAIAEAVLGGDVPPADTVCPEVPRALAAIAARAMARDRALRHAGAASLAEDLRDWLDGPQAATDEATPPTAPAPSQPARWGAPWSAVVVSALVAASWLAFSLREPLPEAATTATSPVVFSPRVAENPADAIAAERTARPADATTEPPPPTRAAPTPPAAKGGRDVRAAAAATATGQVQLAVSPWGTVEVDGRPAGTTPPLTQLTLPEGKHTITLRNADLPPKTLTVHVKAGQPATVRHRFTP